MFLLSLKIKKIVATTIIFSFVFSGAFVFGTKKAQADVPVIDAQSLAADEAYYENDMSTQEQMYTNDSQMIGGTAPKESILARAGRIALKIILRKITLAIVNWINNGFNGNPAFVTNPSQFLKDTADTAIGEMLMGTDLEFLCSPFKLQVKLALGLQYRPFQEQIRCTLTGALANVNGAVNNFLNGDFIGGGGWNSWLQITTVPQNNQMGEMIMAKTELDARIVSDTHNAEMEANWGSGFMSFKDSNGDITTPGQEIVNQMGWANSSAIREMELASDLDAIIGAFANLVITKGLQALTPDEGRGSAGQSPAQTNINYLNSLQAQYNSQLGASGGAGNNANTGSYNSNGSVNFNQTFADKTSALAAIDAQITYENQYLAAQSNISSLLDAAQNIFTSSTCALATTTEIINQITGNHTGNKDLTWNKRDVANTSSTTLDNLTALNQTRSAVNSIANDSSTSGLIQNLTSYLGGLNTLHSANDVSNYSASGSIFNVFHTITYWIQGKITDNRTCVGNLASLAQWGIQ